MAFVCRCGLSWGYQPYIICTNNGLIEISISLFACKAAGFVVSKCMMKWQTTAHTHMRTMLKNIILVNLRINVCVHINVDIICRYCCHAAVSVAYRKALADFVARRVTLAPSQWQLLIHKHRILKSIASCRLKAFITATLPLVYSRNTDKAGTHATSASSFTKTQLAKLQKAGATHTYIHVYISLLSLYIIYILYMNALSL